MKTAITISTEDAFSKAMVVFRGLEKSLPVISELGYDGIELAVWRGDVVDAKALGRLLNTYQLHLPVVSTGQIFTMENVWLTHPEKSVRERAVELLKGIVDFAAQFQADVNISRVRGYVHDGETVEIALDRLSEALAELEQYSGPGGPQLLLEQMNMYETNYLHSVAEVGAYLKSVGLTNVRIHADTFHMNIHDVDMPGVLREYGDLLGYIHFSDSNRLSPGMGHIDFKPILDALRSVGYDGWAGIEAFAEPSDVAAAQAAISYLRSVY